MTGVSWVTNVAPSPAASSFGGMWPLALALLCAPAPALLAWWTGRRLARTADDPLLPELLLAREQRIGQVTTAAIIGLTLFARGMLWWAAPAMVVLTILAAMPMRRRVFGERIGAWTWLEHRLRMLLAGAGPWLLIALTPALVAALPALARVAGGVAMGLAIVAALWGFVPAWLSLNVAAPLDRRDVEPLLRDVAVRARAPMPRLVRFGTPGIHLINAYALPGVRVATVAFSRRLLDTFPPEEIAAVFAHEMAHLEHFDARRMRRARAAAVLMALITVVFALLVPPAWAMAFPLAILVALTLRARRSQGHETESDRRAVELLMGDGEVLARALVRLHMAARLPRRFDRDFEKSASHPSLARRVQSIRAAAAEWRGLAHAAPAGAIAAMSRATPSSAQAAAIVAPAHLGFPLTGHTRTDARIDARADARRTPMRAAAMPLITDVPLRLREDARHHASHDSSRLAPPAPAPVPHAETTAHDVAHADPLEQARAAMFAEPPSLRRLAEAMPLPVMLQSPSAPVVVALGADRVYWFDDVPEDARLDIDSLREAAGSYRALRYADVIELRVAASGAERHLLVRERTGDARRVALHPGDVALAQRALDMVDGQLGHAVHEHGSLVARLLAIALALVAPLGPASGIAAIVAGALVLWSPARPMLVALGGAAIAEAIVGWFTGSVAGSDALGVAGTAVLGAMAIALGLHTKTTATADARRGRIDVALALLGAFAALATAPLALLLGDVSAGEWLDTLAGSALAAPTVGLLAALAGALFARRSRTAPLAWTAGGAVLLAGAVALGGATIAGTRLEQPVAWRDVTATVVARQRMPEGTMRVLASPSGRRWAVQRVVARGTPAPGALMDGWDWDLGSFAEGRTRTVRALQLEFLDDARVVVLARRGDSLEVRLEPAFAGDDPLPRRAAGLPALLNPMLRVDRATGTWHVVGRPRPIVTGRSPIDGASAGTFEDEGAVDSAADDAEPTFDGNTFARPDTMVVAGGRIGTESVRVKRWVLPALVVAALPLADGGVLYQELPRFDRTAPWRARFGMMPRGSLWRLGPDGSRTRLGASDVVQCGSAGPGGEALCVERGARRMRGHVMDATGHPVGQVSVRSGWSFTRAAGARLAITMCGRTDVMLLDAVRHAGTRAVLGERACIVDATPTPEGFLGIRTGDAGLELASWRMPR